MRLFTFATSPYARKVRMALDFKGLSYEPVERCYSLDHKQDLFAANPRAEVPALILDDGRTLADSTIICEYLEDAFPSPPLRPSDPYQRARNSPSCWKSLKANLARATSSAAHPASRIWRPSVTCRRRGRWPSTLAGCRG